VLVFGGKNFGVVFPRSANFHQRSGKRYYSLAQSNSPDSPLVVPAMYIFKCDTKKLDIIRIIIIKAVFIVELTKETRKVYVGSSINYQVRLKNLLQHFFFRKLKLKRICMI